ncbi:hypothetical protein CYMTET_5684, partial [Cymbomonas tetramitiformis]
MGAPVANSSMAIFMATLLFSTLELMFDPTSPATDWLEASAEANPHDAEEHSRRRGDHGPVHRCPVDKTFYAAVVNRLMITDQRAADDLNTILLWTRQCYESNVKTGVANGFSAAKLAETDDEEKSTLSELTSIILDLKRQVGRGMLLELLLPGMPSLLRLLPKLLRLSSDSHDVSAGGASDPDFVTANDFEARKKKMEDQFLQSVIGSSINKEEHESLVATHISDKWITLLNLATASKNDLKELTQFPVQGKSVKSSAWYANDLRDVTTAAIANELDQLQDNSAQSRGFEKEMMYAQKSLRLLHPDLGHEWRVEALNLKNLPTEMQPLCNLESIYDALGYFHFDVRYMFFALDMAKKAVALLDRTERKQHYAKYGIVCKDKYLAPIEFKNFCRRLGFIRDVIEEAKNMFTYLVVGWAKYPDWHDKQESVNEMFENDTDTYLMVANDE